MQSGCCEDSCPLRLICTIVAPYVTLTNMWVRPEDNELVSYESQIISRAEKCISLVYKLPKALWTVSHMHVQSAVESEWDIVKSLEDEGQQ